METSFLGQFTVNTEVMNAKLISSYSLESFDEQAKQKIFNNTSKNIANAVWRNAQIVTSTGTYNDVNVGNEHAACKEFIEVNSNTVYTYSIGKPKTINMTYYVLQYDENKEFIVEKNISKNASGLYSTGMTFTTEPNAKYIRLYAYSNASTSWDELIPEEFQIELGTTFTDYVFPYSLDKLKITANTISSYTLDINKDNYLVNSKINLIDDADWVHGNIKNGVFIDLRHTTINVFAATECFYEVENGKTYQWSFSILNSYFYIDEYTGSKEYIKTSSSFTTKTGNITVSENCKYVRFKVWNNSSTNWKDICPTGCQFKLIDAYSDYESKYVISDEKLNYLKSDKFNLAALNCIDEKYFINSRNVSTNAWAKMGIKSLATEGGVITGGGDIPSSGNMTAIKKYHPVFGGTLYTISWKSTLNGSTAYVFEYDIDKNPLRQNSGTLKSGSVINLLANTSYVRFLFYKSGVTNWEELVPVKFQFEYGNISTEYVNHRIISREFTDDNQYNTLPLYYYDNNYIGSKIDRINQILDSNIGTSDAFIFITDEHWNYNQQHSIDLIKLINEQCGITKVFSGGDTRDFASKDFADKLKNNFNGDVFHATGNHDSMSNTNNMLHHIFDTRTCFNKNKDDTDGTYYYFDDTFKKIRYVVLQAFTYNSATPNIAKLAYDNNQISWLNSALDSLPANYSCIIITHTLNNLNVVDLKNTLIANANKITLIVEGHTHYDELYKIQDTEIPVVVTTCDKSDPWMQGSTDKEPWISSRRINGHISEQAFDVIIYNRKTKITNIIRIGSKRTDCGMDVKDESYGYEEATIAYDSDNHVVFTYV